MKLNLTKKEFDIIICALGDEIVKYKSKEDMYDKKFIEEVLSSTQRLINNLLFYNRQIEEENNEK